MARTVNFFYCHKVTFCVNTDNVIKYLLGSDIRWIAAMPDDVAVAALNVDISAPTRSPEVCCRRLVVGTGTCWVT